MVVVMAVGQVLTVLVLGLLSWPARSVRLRSLLLALLAGALVAAPAAVLVEFVWTRLLGAVSGADPPAVLRVAGYTLDPILEQVLTVLPVALLWLLPRVRRQWGATDFTVLGAASGAGLGLAGAVLRLTVRPAGPVPAVPWSDLALQVGWGALGGLGVALLLREAEPRLRAAGIALVVYTGLDHTAYDWRLTGGHAAIGDALSWPFAALRHLPWAFVLLAVAVAGGQDRALFRLAAGAELDDLTPAERSRRPVLALARALTSRLPASWLLVTGFVRLRRAYRTGTVRAPGAALGDELRDAVIALRDRVAGLAGGAPGRFRGLIRPAARPRRALTVWSAGLVLPVLYLLIGGFPATAGFRRALSSGPAVPLVLLLAVVALGWTGRAVLAALRAFPPLRGHPYAEVPATEAARLAIGAGAALGAVPLLFVLLSHGSHGPVLPDAAEPSRLSSAGPHLLAALGGASPVAVLALLGLAVALFPPGASTPAVPPAGVPAALPAALGRLGTAALAAAAPAGAAGTASSDPTAPSLDPDPNARAEGDPAPVGARLPRDVQRARRRANETADVLARAGYATRRLPPDPDGKQPDLELEGRTFEIKAPRSASPDTVRSMLRASGREPGQRFVLNLDDSQLTLDELRGALQQRSGGRIGEVIVVRGGRVSHLGLGPGRSS